MDGQTLDLHLLWVDSLTPFLSHDHLTPLVQSFQSQSSEVFLPPTHGGQSAGQADEATMPHLQTKPKGEAEHGYIICNYIDTLYLYIHIVYLYIYIYALYILYYIIILYYILLYYIKLYYIIL